MTDIDHAAEARKLIEYAYADDPALLNGIKAVAHAQLALVEQQRIANEQARVANLIAATRLIPDGKRPGVDGWGEDSDSALHSRLADEDTWIALLGPEGYEREKATW